MSEEYERLKQNNLSEEGRERINKEGGGYYEVTLFIDWTDEPTDNPDNYLTVDFVLDDEIEQEFFDRVDFESEGRDDQIANVLEHSLGKMIERGLVLDAYGNDHIGSVDELENHLGDFRIIS